MLNRPTGPRYMMSSASDADSVAEVLRELDELDGTDPSDNGNLEADNDSDDDF